MIRNYNINVSIFKLYIKYMVPTIVLVFLIVLGAIYKINAGLHHQEKKTYEERILDYCLYETETSFNVFFDISKNYNILFNNYNVINNHHRRDFYNNVTEHFLIENNNIANVWVVFEENKFDELDKQYKNTENYSKNGNYCMYFNKIYERHNRKTKIEHNKEFAIEKQKYIELLKTDKLPLIILNDSIIDNIYFTFCFPIFDKKNNVVGVSGVDIAIEKIVNSIDDIKMKLMNGFILASKKATFVYYENIKELVGKSINKSKRIDYKNYDLNLISQQMAAEKSIHLYNIKDKRDTNNRLVSVHYIPIKVRGIYSADAYAGFIFDNVTIVDNSEEFINKIVFYWGMTLLLSIIITIIISLIVEDILSNRIIATVDIDL